MLIYVEHNKDITNTYEILNLYTILMSDNVSVEIRKNLNKLLLLIPKIKNMIGFEHNHPHHHLNVWEHTLYALDKADKDFDLRLALLLHDIGKPFSFVENNGIRRFTNHPIISANMAKIILERLGFKEEYIQKIIYLVKNDDSPITNKEISNNYELVFKRYLMQKYDALAHHPEKLEKRKKY